METPAENRSEIEFPTKFNKYRRMMERTNRGDEGQKEMSNDCTIAISVTTTSDNDSTTTTGDRNINITNNNNNNGLFQNSFSHSPPKKIFISRACDLYCQDVPLNLTTRSKEEDRDKNNSTPKSGDKDGSDGEECSSVEAMDVNSMSDSMIIEDHFKRSLGNLYTSQLKESKPLPPSYGSYSNGVASPNNCHNNNNNNVDGNKFSTNSTPSLSNHFNFALSTIFSPVQLTANPPFIPSSSPTHLSPHLPFPGLINGSSIHDAQFHGNRFLGGLHSNGFSCNVLFNGHHHPTEQVKRSPAAASSSSLHHSSSFNGTRPLKSSSPSSKSTTRHRFTPPDSYQPYPTDVKHRAEVILKTSSADASSVSGCVDDHFSKSLGDVWNKVKASNLSTELEELMPTSVDDHFAKALGDKWFKLKSAETPKKLPTHRNPNFFSSPSSFVVRS